MAISPTTLRPKAATGAQAERGQRDASAWQICILFLPVYVILAMLADTFFRLPAGVPEILNSIDNAVCFVFLADFFGRLATTSEKRPFLTWGWVDLISSIPTLKLLRWGRFVRVIRILRILRGFKSTRTIITFLFYNRAKGAFFSVAMISFILVVFGSIAMLQAEDLTGSNIETPEDALWWAFVTITTVGYGDFYPVSTMGRIVAAVLMTAGVGLFGTFTGYVASLFAEAEEQRQNAWEARILEELHVLREEVAELKSP